MTKEVPQHDTYDSFVVEGVITELHVAFDSANLLAQIDRHCRAGNAPGSFHGNIAAAAAVAFSDGEDTENFACLIDGQVMCGTFGGASKLPSGQLVKAVVARHDDVLVARAILSEDTGLVWVHSPRGNIAECAAGFKLALWCFCFTMVCLTACTFFMGVHIGMTEVETLMWGAIVTGVLCFGMAFWDAAGMDALPDSTADIFRKLGFADPEWVNLNNYQYGIVHFHELVHSLDGRANHADIYCLKKAIGDGKLALAKLPPAVAFSEQ